MSLFRKPKKQQIQRRVFTEHDDDEDRMEADETPPAPPPPKEYKIKIKSSSSKVSASTKPAQSLLSFETEEEGEVFQVKKSSHSKRMMRLNDKERHRKKSSSKPDPLGSVKAGEKVVPTRIVTDDLIMKISHVAPQKPPTPPPPPILSGRDALCAGKDDLSDEDEDEEEGHRFSKPENVKKILESGAIPDAAVIHAARKRRQRARELGGDFVPIEEEETEDTGGRLRREEDQDEGSDEERIDMDANPAIRDHERRREQFLAAQESDGEADQELDEWESQQLRKGVTGAPVIPLPQYYKFDAPAIEAEPAATPVVDPNTQQTPQDIMENLNKKYEQVVASRDSHHQQLRQVQNDLVEINEELQDLQQQAPKAAERFRFYQELRGYVTDLVECLDEKVGVIAELEQKALNLMAYKAQYLMERRRQDVRDQAEEITCLGKGVMRRGPEHEEKVRRAAEREGRRLRRRRAREQQGQPKHVEGMSSDEEITQHDALNTDAEREQLELEVQEVFEDVVEDYSKVSSILLRFENWRETNRTAYLEAYAPLSLPRAVSPLIRLNLVFWDPLNETLELEKLEWYRTLALYGLHDDETEEKLSRDPDINLLPSIVEKLIVPKITQLVEKCWDPLSSSQTLRLVGILSRYIRRFPTLGPASKPLHNLFNSVLDKIKSALENDVFIPLVSKVGDSKTQFFQRQFASGLKLLKNITSLQGILNDNTLKGLALTSLLNRYLLTAIKVCHLTDAVTKMGLISHILPRVWLQSNAPELQMLSSCVAGLGQQLDKNNPIHLEAIETLAAVLKSLRTS